MYNFHKKYSCRKDNTKLQLYILIYLLALDNYFWPVLLQETSPRCPLSLHHKKMLWYYAEYVIL